MSRQINSSMRQPASVGEAVSFPDGNGVAAKASAFAEINSSHRLDSFPAAMPLGNFSSNTSTGAVFATVSVFQATSSCRHLPGSRNRRSKTSR